MSLQRENQLLFATKPYLGGSLNIDRHFCVFSIVAVWNGAEACFMNHLPFAHEAGRTGFPDLRDHLMVIFPPRHVLNIVIKNNTYRNCLSLFGVYCLMFPQVDDAQMLLTLLELMTRTGGEQTASNTGPEREHE